MSSITASVTDTHEPVGYLDQIPVGEGRCFLVGDDLVAISRTRQGAVYATQASCPHRGGPLADGIVGGETLICPLHAYKFSLATGEPIGHQFGALQTYRVSVGSSGELRVET